MTALALTIVFAASRAPFEIYQLMRLFQSQYGFRATPTWGTQYAAWTFDTDIILNAIIYVTCAVHPILYFAFNPEYRQGLKLLCQNLDCNQSSAEVNKIKLWIFFASVSTYSSSLDALFDGN